MDLAKAKTISWIDGMLHSALRREDSAVCFEHDLKTGTVRSYTSKGVFLGAILHRDWHGFTDALRERVLSECESGPWKHLPRLAVPSFDEDFVQCSFIRESHTSELGGKKAVANSG